MLDTYSQNEVGHVAAAEAVGVPDGVEAKAERRSLRTSIRDGFRNVFRGPKKLLGAMAVPLVMAGCADFNEPGDKGTVEVPMQSFEVSFPQVSNKAVKMSFENLTDPAVRVKLEVFDPEGLVIEGGIPDGEDVLTVEDGGPSHTVNFAGDMGGNTLRVSVQQGTKFVPLANCPIPEKSELGAEGMPSLD